MSKKSKSVLLVEEIAASMGDDPMNITDAPPEGIPTPPVDMPAPPVNPAPVAPLLPTAENVQPSGVIRIDVPLFMKLLDGLGCGDVHKLASEAAKMCADDTKVLAVSDYENLCAASAPPQAVIATSMDVIDSDLPGPGGDMPSAGAEIQFDEPTADDLPKGDSIPAEFGSDDGDSDEATDDDLPPFGDEDGDEDGDSDGGKDEKPVDDKKPEKKDDEKPVEESKATEATPPVAENKVETPKQDPPVVENKVVEKVAEVQPTMKPVAEIVENVACPVCGVDECECDKDSDKDSDKDGKKESKKPWESKEPADVSLAEEVGRLAGIMSKKAALVFKDTKNRDVVEFNAKRNANFQKLFAEGVEKVLKNKVWLEKNGFKTLGKYTRAGVINANSGPDTRQFLILK